MMIWRWIYFGLGTCGWIGITATIWHRAGWIFGAFTALSAFIGIVEWLKQTLLKQWKLKEVTTWEETE